LAFAGLAVMIFFVRPESQFTFRASEGALTVVPPAIFSALYAVLGKGYLRRYPPFTFVAWTLLIGTVLLIPLLLATGPSVVADLGRDRGRCDGHRRRGARAATPKATGVIGARLSGFVRAGTSRSSAPCS